MPFGRREGRAFRLFEWKSVVEGLLAFEGEDEDVGASLLPVDAGDHDIQGQTAINRATEIRCWADLCPGIVEDVVVFEI